MDETRTPAGYFIAIITVVGGTFLLPPLPVLILLCPLLLILWVLWA